MKDKETQEHELPNVDGDSNFVATTSQQPSMPADFSQQQSSLSQIQQQVVTQAVADDVSGLQADDVDLIERAWVEKAKAIVRSTHGDPYSQNKELSKVKADYIKKRYSKDIKVIE